MGAVAGGGEGSRDPAVHRERKPSRRVGWGRMGAGCRNAGRILAYEDRGSGHIDPENQGREGKSADEQQAFEKVLGKVLGTQLNR